MSEETKTWIKEQEKKMLNNLREAAEKYFSDTHDAWMKKAKEIITNPTPAPSGPDCAKRITAFRDKKTTIVWEHDLTFLGIKKFLDDTTNYEIYSALSKDGVEYKIGDEALNDGGHKFKITGFYISENNPLFIEVFKGRLDSTTDELMVSSSPSLPSGINIDYIKKAEERKPLLVVENKNLFEGDEYWWASLAGTGVHTVAASSRAGRYSPEDDNFKRFLTYEAANNWLQNSVKRISYQDLQDYVDRYSHPSNNAFCVRLLNHFKSKL